MTKQVQTILYQAIDRFVRRGAKAVILGCTEIKNSRSVSFGSFHIKEKGVYKSNLIP